MSMPLAQAPERRLSGPGQRRRYLHSPQGPRGRGRCHPVPGRAHLGAGSVRPEGRGSAAQTPGYRRVRDSTKPVRLRDPGVPPSPPRPGCGLPDGDWPWSRGIGLHGGEGVTLPSHPSMSVWVHTPISVSFLCIRDHGTEITLWGHVRRYPPSPPSPPHHAVRQECVNSVFAGVSWMGAMAARVTLWVRGSSLGGHHPWPQRVLQGDPLARGGSPRGSPPPRALSVGLPTAIASAGQRRPEAGLRRGREAGSYGGRGGCCRAPGRYRPAPERGHPGPGGIPLDRAPPLPPRSGPLERGGSGP